MEIRRLEYFVCVAEQGSLCQASDVLRIAQPALTRQMRLLEEELGVTLFTRTRRGMRLTEEGLQLMAEVTGPLRQLEGALQNIRCFSSGISGNVAVGMPPTVAYFLAQPLLERVARDEPNIAVRIVEGTSMHLNDWILNGELDTAILYGPSADDKLQTKELIVEEMVLVGSKESNLSPSRSIAFNELTKIPLILPNLRNGLRASSEKLAAKYKAHFQVKYVIDSFHISKKMVEDNHGYSILPVSSVLREIENGLLKYAPIENGNTRTLILASKSHSRSPRILSRLDEIIQSVVFDLFENERIFGELKIMKPQGVDRKAALVVV